MPNIITVSPKPKPVVPESTRRGQVLLSLDLTVEEETARKRGHTFKGELKKLSEEYHSAVKKTRVEGRESSPSPEGKVDKTKKNKSFCYRHK